MADNFMSISLEKATQDLGAKAAEVESLVKGGMKRVYLLALNEAGRSAQQRGSKILRKQYAINAAMVTKHFVLSKARINRLQVSFHSRAKRIGVPLIEFNGENAELGVNVHVLKKSGKMNLRHAFIRPARNSKKPLIFIRISKFGGEKVLDANGKEKILALYGPSFINFMNQEENKTQLEEAARTRFEKRLQHHADRLITQAMEKKK